MLKLTLIILTSIVSAVILQDINQPLNQGEPCSKNGAPVVENQMNTPYISSPPQSLPQENLLHEPKLYEPKRYEPKEYEPIVYKLKEYEPKYDNQNHNNNRRSYPNPILQPTTDEVEKALRHTTDMSKTKDCPLPLDTRRSSRNEAASGHGTDSNEEDDPIFRSDVKLVNDNKKPLLMNNPRVCYACSSASNPTCWEPNRRTTIKYCNKDHASCVTKTFGEGTSLTVIRDCAASCGDSPVPGLAHKYKTCKVCHSDLCNSAFSIKSYNLLYILLLFTAFKFTF